MCGSQDKQGKVQEDLYNYQHFVICYVSLVGDTILQNMYCSK